MVGLLANVITACSSPPQLTEPQGEWVSFDVPQTNQIRSTATPARDSGTAKTLTPYHQTNGQLSSTIMLPKPVSGLFALVTTDGKNIPLYKAVRTIVPQSESISLAPDVAQNFKGNISWKGNDQWPFVLQKALSASGLTALIDKGNHTVIVQYSQKMNFSADVNNNIKAPVASKTEQLKTGSLLVVKGSEKTLSTSKTAPLPVVQGSTKPLTTPVIPVASMGVIHPVPTKPVIKPVPVMKIWKIDKGTTLKAGFNEWVAKETCSADKKWTVRWETDTDYPIDYPLSFNSANFEDATSQLFNLYRRAESPLYVNGFRNQCLIVISDKK